MQNAVFIFKETEITCTGSVFKKINIAVFDSKIILPKS